jgi:hypothetical protein
MKRGIPVILIAVLSLLLAACGAKPTPDADGVIGSYDIKGSNPDKSTYEATLVVTAKGEAFDWSWNDGEYKGVGVQQGDIVSVVWGDDDCYLMLYVVGDDGVLTGKWTQIAVSGIGSEVLTPVDKAKMNGLEGQYDTTGTEINGSKYGDCITHVTQQAEGVYEWFVPNCFEDYYGVGIRNGNQVSVAVALERNKCVAMSYKVNTDGSMDAIWTPVGQSDLGTENATPK